MFKKTAAVIALVFSAVSLHAAQSLSQLEEGASFVSSPDVPAPAQAVPLEKSFDPDAPFNYAQRRAAAAGENGAWTVSNVRWGRLPADLKSYDWRTAAVKPELLTGVYYGYKKKGVGHSFFVFSFLDGGFVAADGAEGGLMTTGAEGWSREPDGYNVVEGIKDLYPLIWNTTSLESYVEYTVNKAHSDLYLAEIKLPLGKARELLLRTFERMNETNRSGEFYNGFTNNCTTNPVDLLNAVLPEGKRISGSVFSATFPFTAVHAYVNRGVLTSFSRHIKIGEENYSAPFNPDTFVLR
jgi:hypothetical protein